MERIFWARWFMQVMLHILAIDIGTPDRVNDTI